MKALDNYFQHQESQQQQQQQQAQPASWSAIAAQGAAKGTGSPPAPGSAGRAQSSGMAKRGSAQDLRLEQVIPFALRQHWLKA